LQEILQTALERARPATAKGRCASYIPELTKADPHYLGISIRTTDGRSWHVGDYRVRFTIQSISKIITLMLAFETIGYDAIFSKVGMEPSGEAFNAFVDLDVTKAFPSNPMINAGALVVVNSLAVRTGFDELLAFARKICADDDIDVNEETYQSEMSNIARNRSIAYLLQSKGIIDGDVELTLALYTRMCSLNVTADSLADLGALLANDGREPITGQRFISHRSAQIAKTIMLTCGMYDGSGEFAVKVGIPTKSGVGGGLLSVADNRMGIGIFGPALDKKGNSVAGQEILEYLSTELDLHLFGRNIQPY